MAGVTCIRKRISSYLVNGMVSLLTFPTDGAKILSAMLQDAEISSTSVDGCVCSDGINCYDDKVIPILSI